MFKKVLPSIVAAALVIACVPGCASVSSTKASSSVKTSAASASSAYEESLFDTSYVHDIDIQISDADWADLIANPTEKTKYEVNVTIDGSAVDDVSFSTKGNTSLSSVADDANSNRYSFKINFGKYVDGQTYLGLDKLSLNNIYADATYMKDYFSYRIMEEAGGYAPSCSYIWVKVNGQDIGLYLAVEDVGESWLNRETGGEGELYKPETAQLENVGNQAGGDAPAGMANGGEPPVDVTTGANGQSTGAQTGTAGVGAQPPNTATGAGSGDAGNTATQPTGAPGAAGQNGGGAADGQGGAGAPGAAGQGFGSQDSGASLKYTDDNIESYSDIFDNAETKADEQDEARVVAALKSLSEGDAASALYEDEVIDYFAAHNFVMNYDSYTGNMLHNYYLYENEGKLGVVAWDYNLAFGAFMNQGNKQGTDSASTSDSTKIVNYGIDTPLSGASEEDRPLWSWITSSDESLNAYHAAMDKLISGYFESGTFDTEIQAVHNLIEPYVEKDPSAFYSADEFETGYKTLEEFCDLRAKSIRLQLNGSLSANTDGQDAASKVDASAIEIADMGTQGASGGQR